MEALGHAGQEVDPLGTSMSARCRKDGCIPWRLHYPRDNQTWNTDTLAWTATIE